MADFTHYKPILAKLEGSWSDNKKDKGGATMRGVTLNTFKQFYGSQRTKEDLRNITDEQWEHIMKSYWDRCRADEIQNQSIAELLVDWYINAGANAIKGFQHACGLDTDGVIGPKSLAILNSPNSEVIFNRIKYAREEYYCKLARSNAPLNIFLTGWLNRTNSFKFAK